MLNCDSLHSERFVLQQSIHLLLWTGAHGAVISFTELPFHGHPRGNSVAGAGDTGVSQRLSCWGEDLWDRTSLVAQMVKRLSTMRETRVLGREDPLEKEMAIHSSTIAWKILWTEEPGRLQPMGSQRVGHD